MIPCRLHRIVISVKWRSGKDQLLRAQAFLKYVQVKRGRSNILLRSCPQENFVRLQAVLIVLVLLLARKSPAQRVFDSHVHLWEGEKSLRQYEAAAKTAGIDLVGLGGMWF